MHDFAAPLTQARAKERTRAFLSEAAFEARWRAAMDESSLKLLRSFPGLWWEDLRTIDPARIPSGETVGCGDAHPDNFGFLAFDKGVRLAFNDLDDSGVVPIALDALRYFTALNLKGEGDDLAELTRLWADSLDTETDPTASLPDAEQPTAERLLRKARKKWDDGKDLADVDDDVRDAVVGVLAEVPATAKARVVGVRRRTVEDGGSGGLARYWALVARDDAQDVIELKEQAPPGAEEGNGATRLDDRMSVLKKIFWRGLKLSPYRTHPMGNKTFLVRSRGQRGDAREVDRRWHAKLLGAVHGRGDGRAPKDKLAAWVLGSIETMTARWQSFYDANV